MTTATITSDPRRPPRNEWPEINDYCPMFVALGTLSTRSAFLVLREAFYGATRFDQFVERANLSEPVVASRLKELAAAGLLDKVPYQEPGQRTRSEYQLTEMGSELLPTLVTLARWGGRWLFPENVRRGEIVHAGCGAGVDTVFICDEGHPVGADELQFRGRRPRS